MSKVDKMLMPGEEVLLTATQSRVFPGGSLVTPNDIYVTNKRVIWRDPYMLGLKKDFRDFAYRDLANVEQRRGVFTTEIELIPRFEGEHVLLPAVKKKIAEQLFSLIRQGISGALETASLGLGDQVSVQQYTATDAISKLERLASLRDSGVISEDEYQEKRAKLLEEI